MTAPDTTAYQANFKVGNDLHNVYSTNGQDFLEQLDFFAEEALPKILSIHQTISAGLTVTATLPVASAPQQNITAPAAPAPAQAGGETHLCEHGQPMRLVPAGISKATGKPYKAFYACNQPRGQQCNTKVTV